MKIKEALNILQPEVPTLQAVKKAYREFALKYHPDRNPNSLEMMKLGNLAHEILIEKDIIWMADWDRVKHETTPDVSIDEEINELFQKIKHFHGIHAEVCGTWLWLSGNTKRYKDQLKDLGFQWASKKKMWSWHPKSYHKRSRRGEWSMEEIRGCFGATDLEGEELDAMVA